MMPVTLYTLVNQSLHGQTVFLQYYEARAAEINDSLMVRNLIN